MTRWRIAGLGAALAAAVAAVVVLPSCTRKPENVVRLMIWGSPDEITVVKGFLTAFHKVHPEIHVQVEHTPGNYMAKLQTLFLGGNAPDVMYLDQDYLPNYASRGWLMDLTPLLERDRAEVDPGDYYQAELDRFRYHGRLYGICKDFATLVLYYNKDLFEKWDVPYPKPGWTWDDFLQRARALSRGGDYGFLMETWPRELFPWIWQAGGAVAQDDPPEWLMGEPRYLDKSARGLQFLSDLIWKYHVSPGPSVTRDQQGNALFLRGKAAMCTYGRWACMEFRHIKAFDWGVVELPRDRRQATVVFAVAYVMSAHTKKKEKAWTLIKFLTSKQSERAVAESAQAIPSRRSVAESDAFLHPEALSKLGYPVDSSPNIKAVSYGRFAPRFKTFEEARYAFNQGIEPLWDGSERDAKKLLERLQPKLQAITARSRQSKPPAGGKKN